MESPSTLAHAGDPTRTVWVVMCTAGAMALVVGLVGASMSCLELYYTEEATRSPGTVAPDECYSDEECALRPAQITCCGVRGGSTLRGRGTHDAPPAPHQHGRELRTDHAPL